MLNILIRPIVSVVTKRSFALLIAIPVSWSSAKLFMWLAYILKTGPCSYCRLSMSQKRKYWSADIESSKRSFSMIMRASTDFESATKFSLVQVGSHSCIWYLGNFVSKIQPISVPSTPPVNINFCFKSKVQLMMSYWCMFEGTLDEKSVHLIRPLLNSSSSNSTSVL